MSEKRNVSVCRGHELANALYKKGSKRDVANYRPICLTSVVCKILERILKANILQDLKKLPF